MARRSRESEQEKIWQARRDLETLRQADEIKSDYQRLQNVKAESKKQEQAVQRAAVKTGTKNRQNKDDMKKVRMKRKTVKTKRKR